MSERSEKTTVRADDRLPGFTLHPIPSVDSGSWWRGTQLASGRHVLVRIASQVPFADALRELPATIEIQQDAPAGIAPALAVAVIGAGGRVAAGAVMPYAGFGIPSTEDSGESLPPDAPVDVLAVYADAGQGLLDSAANDPVRACEKLLKHATILDGLAAAARMINGRRIAAHGSLDSPCLRMNGDEPLLMGLGFDRIDAIRRARLGSAEPWHMVSPESCLTPGEPGPRSDQYALAVLWATARMGHPPYRENDPAALVRAKLAGPPALGPLAETERGVIARAMSASSADRYASSAEFIAALLAACSAVAAEGNAKSIVSKHAAAQPPSAMENAGSSASPPAATAEELARTTPWPAENEPSPVGLTSAMPLAAYPYKPGDLILPGYRLVKQLGKGGFGEVWKATAPGGMSVAIKVIANLERREGAREYRALRTVKDIRHAHIVPMFGVWLKMSDGRLLDEGEAVAAERRLLSSQENSLRETIDSAVASPLAHLELVIAMGLGDQTLYDRLKRSLAGGASGLEVGPLLVWMRQAALAIDHFNRGPQRIDQNALAVQHCDIKPQNMLLVGNVVQVCDFGLARVQGEVRATANNLLSIAYAAPEMTIKPYDPSPGTDQYSLAVTYYELRTGRLPYGGQEGEGIPHLSSLELLRAKGEGAVNLSAVPAVEGRVLRRALSIDPAQRFSCCEEFVDALEAAVEQSAHSTTDSLSGGGRLPSARSLAAFGAGGVLLVGLVASLLLPQGNVARPIAPTPTSNEEPASAADAADASSFDPRTWQARNELGRSATLRGNYDTAIAEYTAALALLDHAPADQSPAAVRNEILARRSYALVQARRFTDAADGYTAVHSADTTGLAAKLWDLQQAAAEGGDIQAARNILQRLEGLVRPGAPQEGTGLARWEILNTLAWYLACDPGSDDASGRRAVELANEALVMVDDENRAQVLDSLAAAHARTGQWEKALQQIDAAIGGTRDAGQKAEFQRHREAFEQHRPWNQP